jgi:hypothetical protein
MMEQDEPHLPHDLFPFVLAPLACDAETLCAACCVSKGFRDAAEAHPLWRDLFARSSAAAATWRARAARRLDDVGFRALVRRAGAAADAAAAAFAAAAAGEEDSSDEGAAAGAEPPRPWCVDVRNFRRLTARDVIAALGARKVLWLDVGGLRAEPADAAQALLPALRALLTLPRGGIDVDSRGGLDEHNAAALLLCGWPTGDNSSRCSRLSLGPPAYPRCEVCTEDEQLQELARRHAKIAATHARDCAPHAAAETRASDAIEQRCAACGNDICDGDCSLEYRWGEGTSACSSCGTAFCAACCASGELRGCTGGSCSPSVGGRHSWCRTCAPEALVVCRGKTCNTAWCQDCYISAARGYCAFTFSHCAACGANAGYFCGDCATGKREMVSCWCGEHNGLGSSSSPVCRNCAFDASSSDVRDDGMRFCATWTACTRNNGGRGMPICRECFEEWEGRSCEVDGCANRSCDGCFDESSRCETCNTYFCPDCAQRCFRAPGAAQCTACAGAG